MSRPVVRFSRAILVASFAVAMLFVALPAPAAAQVCGNGVIEGDEECDDGMSCIGGDNAGTRCMSASDCIGKGACQDTGTLCDTDADCIGSKTGRPIDLPCVRCAPVGGDGCAANCTRESEVVVQLNPDVSRITLQWMPRMVTMLSLEGTQRERRGKARASATGTDEEGVIPIVVKVGALGLQPVKLAGLLCACVRVMLPDGAPFGPDNSGAGLIGCGAKGLAGVHSGVNPAFLIDHNIGKVGVGGFTADICTAAGGKVETAHSPHPGVCNGPARIALSGDGPQGSAVTVTNTATGTVSDNGTCATETETRVCTGGSNSGSKCTEASQCKDGGACVAAKGPDGIPCNDDDPVASQGIARTLVTTTGTATVLHAGNTGAQMSNGTACGSNTCVDWNIGNPFSVDFCNDPTNGPTAGQASVGAFGSVDTQTLGDNIMTNEFLAQGTTPIPTHTGTPTATSNPVATLTHASAPSPTVTATITATPTSTATSTPSAAATDTPTPTDTATPTPTPSYTPTPTPTARCVGDCDGRSGVTVDELVKGVNIALGRMALNDCRIFDSNNDGRVTVDELVTAVNNALNGCPR